MSSVRTPSGAIRPAEGLRTPSARVVRMSTDVVVGAAVRAGLRQDADQRHLAALLEALTAHAARGDAACALLVPWFERRIAAREETR